MKIIPKYRLELVREKGSKYDADEKRAGSPFEARGIMESMFNISNQAEEICVIIGLDTKNNIIGGFEVSRGSLNASLVHPREVFKRALLLNASSIILGHNHPSGDTQPSTEDKILTNRLYEGGKLLGVNVIDHIICGYDSYYSFKEEGHL